MAAPATQAAPKFVAYYRVSTDKQGRSGLGLEAQQSAVLAFMGQAQLIASYRDIESGKNDARPQLRQALDHCQMTGARLLIAKLDRLSRSLSFIAELMQEGVRFTAVDMPDANELTIHIMAAVAHAERKAISERTKAALGAAKARGTKLGTSGPANLRNQLEGSKLGNMRKAELADKAAVLAVVKINEAKAKGAQSLRQIADDMNARGFTTARGNAWSSVQVMRALDRVSN